jgi:putative phage-type endonuclease
MIKQGSPEWLAERKGMITASIAAGALGLSPHMSRQKAFRLVLGLENEDVNAYMKWGMAFEEVARTDYQCETGYLVEEAPFVRHPTIPWLGASPDCFVGSDGLAEFKCPQKLPLNVPIHYRVQMLVQLACTGRNWCDFYAWTQTGTFLRRVYPSGVEGIIRRLEAFQRDFVLTGIEPPRKKPKPRRKAG